MKPSRYHELIHEFPLRPIRSVRQLKRAGKIAFRLAAQKSLSRGEEDYLEVLSDLIEKYEEEHYGIDANLCGSDALTYLIEENNLTLSRLAAETDIKVSTISEIMHGKRDLSLNHIRKLCTYFRVEPGLFVQPLTAPRPE